MSGDQKTKRGRGRPAGFRMSDEHRTKIQNSKILSVLIEHAEGKRELSSTQVAAGLGLMKKVLPDLASVAISNEDDKPFKIEETGAAAKLAAMIEAIAQRSREAGEPSPE